MATYRLAAGAQSDLEAISDYIAADNPLRAISFVEEIAARFDTIAERPLTFPLSADLPPPYRSALHGKYRIIFHLVEDVPHIVRVAHGARDIVGLLTDE